jgi:hypothetical protein
MDPKVLEWFLDDDAANAATNVAPVLAAIITALDNSPHGGSLPGKAPNRNRRFSQGHQIQ